MENNQSITKPLRLNQFIAKSINCSRREADFLIKSGLISVNGESITQMGVKIKMSDIVKYKNSIITSELIYIVHNSHNKRLKQKELKNLIQEYSLQSMCSEMKQSSGINIYTNDEYLIKKIRIKKNIIRVFQLTIENEISCIDLQSAQEMLTDINDKNNMSYIKEENKINIGIKCYNDIGIIYSIFEKIKSKIISVELSMFANITKKDLPRNEYRNLSIEEINLLKRI